MAIDSFMVAILQLCQQASNPDFIPLEVHLRREDEGRAKEYIGALQAPVFFATDEDALYIDTELLDQPLPGHNIDLAQSNDRAIEQYLENMGRNQVATEVRKLLINVMPSGEATQENIARRMNRSLSTLQRQLNTEGTSFRDIAAKTKCTLAESYIEEGKYSLSQIAYLLGFSDQSSFTRAFRRWTGSSPGEFRICCGAPFKNFT
jgi:AraC-like DNA-binding protein